MSTGISAKFAVLGFMALAAIGVSAQNAAPGSDGIVTKPVEAVSVPIEPAPVPAPAPAPAPSMTTSTPS
jgi:hypothetical protein